jgi:hypothetical protein
VTAPGGYELLIILAFILLVLPVGLLPIIVAAVRKHHQLVPIVLVTVFLGWTIIGWIVALVLALGPTGSSTARSTAGSPGVALPPPAAGAPLAPATVAEAARAPSVAAGWYADPARTGRDRWWDGYAWTAHLRPTAGADDVDPGSR